MGANYNYKWVLRKGGKKDICPSCGQRRFVPYVLAADGVTPAGREFGRCDREQSCGYFRYPGGERYESKPLLYAKTEELKTMEYQLPKWKITDDNTLRTAFAGLVGDADMVMAMAMYHCGTAADGSCIFPQYDGKSMRTAKAIRYGSDGHRMKGDDGESLPVYWWHKAPGNEPTEGHAMRQCLFGQHLLTISHFDGMPVWVVESEKTAVLMAATDTYETRRVWLACGGSQMLKGAIDLSCLNGRDVVLVPDNMQYWNWLRTAEANGWQCLDISVLPMADELPAGYDIWDVREAQMRKGGGR